MIHICRQGMAFLRGPLAMLPARLVAGLLLGVLIGCNPASEPAAVPQVPTPFPSLTSSPSPTASPGPTATALATPEPFGCLKPPEDYEVIEVDGWKLNRRTVAMLQHAAELYGGELEITGYAITQGSFHDNGTASFGTHLGGGAVDLSVMRTGTYTVLYDDIPLLIRSLRAAGFAAWLRDLDELYPGSAIHIHAIAIGDRELSEAAKQQLTGTFGYFRGYNGVPQPGGTTVADPHGGPLICQWMIDQGFTGLRTVTPAVTS